MSTRTTLAWVELNGMTYHLYEEMADSENIYLEAYPDGLGFDDEIRIPLEVWRELRKYGNEDARRESKAP